MQNYGEVLKAQTIESDSAGLAQQRYAIYLDSVQAHMNKLTDAWNKLATDTANSKVVKTFIDLGTALIGFVDKAGLFNTVLTLLIMTLGNKYLPSIISAATATTELAATETAAAAATSLLSLGITFGLSVAIIGLSALFKELNKTIVDTYSIFESGKSSLSENESKINDLATQYESLAKKQNKTQDDINGLISIQNTLNDQYGSLSNGLDVYSGAIDNNTTAIDNNISKIKELSKTQIEQWLQTNKAAYDQAQATLNKTNTIATMGGPNNMSVVGETKMTQEETLAFLAKQASLEKDVNGAYHQSYTSLKDQLDAAQKIVDETNEQKTILNEMNMGSSSESPFSLYSIRKQIDAIKLQKENVADLEAKVADSITSFSSMQTQLSKIVSGFQENGEIDLSTVEQLKKILGDDYVKVVDVVNGKLVLNVQALHDVTKAQALAAYQVAQHALVLDPLNSELQKEVDILKMVYDSISSGSWLDNAADAQKAYQDILKDTIDMIKEQINVQKDALQQELADYTETINAEKQLLKDRLDAYTESIDKQKQALDDKYEKQKSQLQSELDGYKAIIDARKRILEQLQAEQDYKDAIAEQTKAISDIDNELLQIQFDNSDEAKAKRLQLEDSKNKALKTLNKTQTDYQYTNEQKALDDELASFEDTIKTKEKILDEYHKKETRRLDDQLKAFKANIDKQTKALDAQLVTFKKNIDTKIKALDDYLKQTGVLESDAIKLLNNHTDAFYQSLMQWNQKFGSGVDDLIEKWRLAISTIRQAEAAAEGMPNSPFNQPGSWESRNDDNTSYDDGGWAGGAPILSGDRVFGDLMKGEHMSTPDMVHRFLQQTLPNIVASNTTNNNGGETNITIPISVYGSVDKGMIETLTDKIFDKFNKAIQIKGQIRPATAFSV